MRAVNRITSSLIKTAFYKPSKNKHIKDIAEYVKWYKETRFIRAYLTIYWDTLDSKYEAWIGDSKHNLRLVENRVLIFNPNKQ